MPARKTAARKAPAERPAPKAKASVEAPAVDDAVVTAPAVEQTGPEIKLVSRRENEELDEGLDYRVVTSTRFVGWNLAILGEGFLHPGEVIIDVARSNGQDHQRFSTWTDDGKIDVPVPGIAGHGDWVVRCEQVVTQVGEGRGDQVQRIIQTDPAPIDLY